MRPPAGLACILLAAGESRRLGRPKQLLRQRGLPLLARSLLLARQLTGDSVVVVLGAEHLRMQRSLRQFQPACLLVRNAGWQYGMAGSVQAGIEQLPRQTKAALILLVDQIDVGRDDLLRLAAAWRQHPGQPVAANYAGRPGAPAIIPRRLFRDLMQLQGDRGAAALIRNLPSTIRVEMPAAAADIDTPEDAQRYLRSG